MAWHLNLNHGYYSRRVPNNLAIYTNKFGVKDGNRRIILGDIILDLVELQKKGLIRIERGSFYRIKVWYVGSSFYVSTSRDNGPKHYLDLSYPEGY